MEKVLNKLMIGSIIMSAILTVLGIVLLVVPDISWIVISYTLATLLIVGGIYLLFFGYKDVLGIRVFDGVTPGIISFLLGLIIFLKPIAFATLVPLILGVWFITTGAIRIRLAMSLRLVKDEMWLVTLLMALLTLTCGLLLIFNPLTSILLLTQVVGIITIIYSLADIIDVVIFKTKLEKFKKAFK